MAETRVLFLDVATRSGFAIDADGGTRPRLGTFRVPANGEDIGQPCSRFQRWLTDMLTTHRPDMVGFEAPLVMSGRNGSKVRTNIFTVRLLFGLATMVEVVCHDTGITCREVNVQQVKKSFAGHGRAEKTDMIARCRELGWDPKDHNEADAAAGWAQMKTLYVPGWAAKATPMFSPAASERDRLFARQEDGR